jgi:hypothetical protein
MKPYANVAVRYARRSLATFSHDGKVHNDAHQPPRGRCYRTGRSESTQSRGACSARRPARDRTFGSALSDSHVSVSEDQLSKRPSIPLSVPSIESVTTGETLSALTLAVREYMSAQNWGIWRISDVTKRLVPIAVTNIVTFDPPSCLPPGTDIRRNYKYGLIY